MSVKDRLRTLRRQAGHGLPTDADVSARIERLRPRPMPGGSVRRRGDDAQLADLVGGSIAAPGVVLIERRLSLSGRHGNFPLARLTTPPHGLPEAADLPPEELVFLDTETTGLAGGTGTVVFLLGLARIEGTALRVRQYLLTAFTGEPALLELAAAWLRGSAAVVTFNGKRFDVPLLAARCRLAQAADPFSAMPHVDLLYPTRRAYGARWEDCRLVTAERRLLGFARQDDLPGAQAPAAWFSLIHAGDPARLPAVVRHNWWDLVSLAALLGALAEAHVEPARRGADVLAVARMHLRHGDESKARELLYAHAAQLDAAGLLELARLHRRRGTWSEACLIWERLAGSGCLEAVERLAKYHEHVCCDYATALGYASRLPTGEVAERRRRRLREKAATRSGIMRRAGSGVDRGGGRA